MNEISTRIKNDCPLLMTFYGILLNRTTADKPLLSFTFSYLIERSKLKDFEVTTSEILSMLFILTELKAIDKVRIIGADLHPISFRCYVINRDFKC